MDKPDGMSVTHVLFVSAIIIYLSVGCVSAMYPPTDIYCKRMGYNLTTARGPAGVAIYCILPDGVMCTPKDFLEGTCGAQYSYCVKKGYGLKLTGAEAKCVLEDGSEEWVSLMVKEDRTLGGVFVEEKLASRCGDGVCFQNENFKSCPHDCFFPSTTPSPSTSAPSTSSTPPSTPPAPDEPVQETTTTVLKPVQPSPAPREPEGIPFYVYFVGVTLVMGAGYYFVLKSRKTGSG